METLQENHLKMLGFGWLDAGIDIQESIINE